MTRPCPFRKTPFKRLVILGESTVEGGGWLARTEDRFADILVRLINDFQEKPMEYFNKGIGANSISPRSPGYPESVKPSALERYRSDVIELNPDLFILCYGLNDMRAGMPLEDFREDMATIIRDVREACSPLTVLTTVYHMTAWMSYPPYDRGSVERTMAYNDCIRGLAEEFGCVFADVWSGEGSADWVVHYDGVHANRVGNLLIANRIFEAVAHHAPVLADQEFELHRDTDWTRETLSIREKDGDPFRQTW